MSDDKITLQADRDERAAAFPRLVDERNELRAALVAAEARIEAVRELLADDKEVWRVGGASRVVMVRAVYEALDGADTGEANDGK